MNNNDEYPLKEFHDVMHFLGHIITWGGFMGIVIIATKMQGFPDGLVGGLLFGSIFAAISGFGNYKSHRDAIKAGKKLDSFFQGELRAFQVSKQSRFAMLWIMILGLGGIVLLLSCQGDICKRDPTRIMIAFIFIGFGIIVEKLLYEERIKGKLAMVAGIILFFGMIYLAGKVFHIW